MDKLNRNYPNDYFNGVAMIDASTALVVGYAVYKTTEEDQPGQQFLPPFLIVLH